MHNEESDAIQLAAADVEYAQYELDHAQYDLRDRLLAALDTGANHKVLAKEAGLTVRQLRELLRLPDENGTS